MKYCVYSVKDELVGFGRPFYVQENGRADQVAIRSVKEALAQGVFGETAHDSTLYKIGTYDDKTAQHENYKFPEVLLRLVDLVLDGDKENEISEDV